jgi:putative tryptophan/tyrosine transport system substrate-binding protein
MRRREFITGLGGAAAWPVVGRAQHSKAAVIGFLTLHVDGSFLREIIPEVRRGLSETGYFEGRNLAFEYRTAEGHVERLPALADNLVRLKVAAIIATSLAPALAAQAARSQPYFLLAPTRSIPDWSAALIGRTAISPALPV